MSKVISMPAQETEAQRSIKLLETTLAAKPTGVVVIGVDENGAMSLGSSMAEADTLWMMEQAKLALLTGAAGE